MAFILSPSVEEFHLLSELHEEAFGICSTHGVNGILFKKNITISPRFGKHLKKNLIWRWLPVFVFLFDRMLVIDDINSVP